MIWGTRQVSTFRTLIAEVIFKTKIMETMTPYQALFNHYFTLFSEQHYEVVISFKNEEVEA